MTEFCDHYAPAREAGEFLGAVSCAPSEFSESIKKVDVPARTGRRDGKNPRADRLVAGLLDQGGPTPYQADARTPSDWLSPTDRTTSAPPSMPDCAELSEAVTREVSGFHARMREGLSLGVDIGNSGGLALVRADGTLVAVQPMPVLQDGPRSRPTVNAPLLAALVRRWAPSAAFVELVGPRPGEAAGGAFSFGRARGLIEGVLAAQGVPARMVTAPVWKRHVGIPAGRDGVKDLARAEACRRWPHMADRFAAKGSDGLAEAGLIAVAGMAREAGR